MASYISVPRDLSKVKTKVFMNLTKRQILCFGAGALIGVPVFFLLKSSGNLSLAALGMMAVMLPLFFLAMYEKDGQPLEVVAKHLMTEMLKPESGESIYDPTCGSAGMLISAIAYLKEQGKEWRNVAVYGQEINALTSAIGKMNLFLHGVKDFNIVNGDTLKAPAFVENGRLKQFDLILANPPYSISQWDRAAFESDKYGRNFLGVPPQGRAD